MNIKKYILFVIFLFIAITSVLSRCGKFDCSKTIYNFKIYVKAFPDKDTLRLGDTLWIDINAPVALEDLQSGKQINYSGALNLGSSIAFEKNITTTGYMKAANEFNFLLTKGKETSNSDPQLFHVYLFEETNERFVFRLGIIPKEPGLYGIVISNAANVYRKNDKCTKASFAIYFKNTDQHYYLNPNYHGGPVAPGGDYYFVVK